MICYDAVCPAVSIIILNYNKPELTIDCLNSLLKYTTGYRFEIIVVDNGSTHDNFNKLRQYIGPHKILRLEINRYFGEGNNIGAEFAKGEFLVFMNNDVTVTENWLEPLRSAFEKYPNCGISGPKFIYPNGVLQEAGALINEDGVPVQLGKYLSPDEGRFNVERPVDYISAATLMIPKNLFNEIEGFDFIYEPAYYEDVDLCMKVLQSGYTVRYMPTSCVIHHENATSAAPENRVIIENIVEINHQRFVRKWADFLRKRSFGDEHQLLERKQNFTKSKVKTAAIYTPYDIIPGGGERFILTIAESLINRNFETYLIVPEIYSNLRISKIGKEFNLDLSNIKILPLSIGLNYEPFDVFFSLANEVVPSIPALGKDNIFICQFPFKCNQSYIYNNRNSKILYSKTIVYSEFVHHHLIAAENYNNCPSKVIEILNPSVDFIDCKDFAIKTKSILNIGRFFIGGHCKNQLELIKAFKRLVDRGFDGELKLVGSLQQGKEHRQYFIDCQNESQGYNIHFYVDASKEIVEQLCRTSSVYWHAAGLGVDSDLEPEKCEHFGISIIEAMSSGVIPIAVKNGGPAITINNYYNGFLYSDCDELVEITYNLFNSQENYINKIRINAQNRAKEFSRQYFENKLDGILNFSHK
jgi:GT2 family glycosyltransferase/glycosyltransferase involved in cell wall biosynthesis